MTTHNEAGQGHPFIERAQELYQTNPLAAAIVLTEGVDDLLKGRGLTLAGCGEQSNKDIWHPGLPQPTAKEQGLGNACWSLARTARDAATGIAPDPEEWAMDVGIAKSAIRLMGEVHG